MKQLLSQNGIKIYPKLFKEFSCKNCGAIFVSDEYNVRKRLNLSDKMDIIYFDECFTCSNPCIIETIDAED